MFKGFLPTLTLPREEVVTVRGPIHRAQPPFHPFLFYRVPRLLPSFFSLFRACLGLGTIGTTHERLDPSLRSPTRPILHLAVAGARVPTRFPGTAAAAISRVPQPVTPKPSLATPTTASPTPLLVQRG
ncbi:hypothetical protein CRG98_018557 [Punica granatum]|uniref:Uncharacterized protein n=1 Tax=Punica granatum TaxID=22663 RepID=A0A2I0JXP1_PUNGR|nr:hypothetical protein CRG98_018557 [Punica granatum]